MSTVLIVDSQVEMDHFTNATIHGFCHVTTTLKNGRTLFVVADSSLATLRGGEARRCASELKKLETTMSQEENAGESDVL